MLNTTKHMKQIVETDKMAKCPMMNEVPKQWRRHEP